MVSFLSRLFGKGKDLGSNESPQEMIERVIMGIFERGGFDLQPELSKIDGGYHLNILGADASLVTSKDALLLDSIQIFIKRMLQNKFPEQRIELEVDCEGYLQASAEELQSLAEKLKNLAIQKGQAYYVRALPPRDRKVVHRYLADEPRVKSQSVGEGFCKKIKITPVKSAELAESGNFQ